jgi:predicted nucleic acid-binding protein
MDTNVLVYALLDEGKKSDQAIELLRSGSICISAQVLNEFANVAIKKAGLTVQQVRELVQAILEFVVVEPVGLDTHLLGLELCADKSFSVYDAMIIAAAMLAKCDRIYTEDMQDGRVIKNMVIENPFI